PEAIFQSLKRRRERLERRLRAEELLQRGAQVAFAAADSLPALTEEDIDELEDAPDSEQEEVTEEVVDQATAASTIAELKLEIVTLERLEGLAAGVRRGGQDTKWRELASLLGQLFGAEPVAGTLVGSPAGDDRAIAPPVPSPTQKLVLFTEHRDTLNYLE